MYAWSCGSIRMLKNIGDLDKLHRNFSIRKEKQFYVYVHFDNLMWMKIMSNVIHTYRSVVTWTIRIIAIANADAIFVLFDIFRLASTMNWTELNALDPFYCNYPSFNNCSGPLCTDYVCWKWVNRRQTWPIRFIMIISPLNSEIIITLPWLKGHQWK